MTPGEDRLQSLGDLMALIVEGWRIERMFYADRIPGGATPAAYFDLTRRGEAPLRVHVPADGRVFSHQALVALFRESPHVWKYRSPEAAPPQEIPAEPTWAERPDRVPHRSAFRPTTLRRVVAVNQTQCVDDLHVALTALECHENGARLRYMAHASDAVTRRQMALLDVAVVDDLGRRYTVDPGESTAEGNHLAGALTIAPAIGDDVRRLTVTVGTLTDGDGEGLRALGPWVFPIVLQG